MGAMLGAIFIATLLALNAHHIRDAVLHGPAPAVNFIIIAVGVSGYFGFGAAITGFYFVMMDDGPEKDS
jgi:hypothetical protein